MARRLRIDDLTAIALPEQPTVSPDGSTVVYVLRGCDPEVDREVSCLWRVDTGGDGKPRRLTTGPADSRPAWAPDGRRVAFLRTTDGVAQLWVLAVDGGEPEQVTRLPLGAGRAVWSPDGSRVAFTATVDRHAPVDEDAEGRRRRAHAPVVTDRLGYHADGSGLLGARRPHVHVLDLGTGVVVRLTDGDRLVGEPAWAPDGRRLAFSVSADVDADPDADLTWRTGVCVLDLAEPGAPVNLAEATGREPRPIESAHGVGGSVTWTTCGRALIVAGKDGPVVGHTRLWRVPLDGAPRVDLTRDVDRNVMQGAPGYPGGLPQPTHDGRHVLFCVRDAGFTHLYAVDWRTGATRAEYARNGHTVSGVSVARHADAVALVLATPTSYGEIAVLDPVAGTMRVLTAHGPAALPDVALFAPVERRFTGSDGTVVHGWLLRDPDAAAPGPLLLDIHGGPHNAWSGTADAVHLYHQVLVARGWSVLILNPRGSDGYGEDFYTAGVGAWGAADARDLLEPLDRLVEEGVADPRRLAVTGYSYGGFMACHLTARDRRFAAAVAGGPISDLASMAGTSDLGSYIAALELAATPRTDPDRYARLSPLTDVARVRTPTLVLQGAADARCPIGQAQQWFTALREQRVPTRLVLYPKASHLFIRTGRPSHRTDWNRRIVDWVEHHAGPDTEPTGCAGSAGSTGSAGQ
jgi:dipeptidyl aminopeptidase/acylaminoacyl peptidase